VKKWFNIKSKAEDFQADDVSYIGDFRISSFYAAEFTANPKSELN